MNELCIDQKTLEEIITIIRKFYPKSVVWAYGSRIKNDIHSGSDLDLVIKDFGQENGQISVLKEAFTESNIPFLIDVLEFDRLPKSFQKEIEEKYVVIHDGMMKQENNNEKNNC